MASLGCPTRPTPSSSVAQSSTTDLSRCSKMASSSSRLLSSNDLNLRLKNKRYSPLLKEVRAHLAANPKDALSAKKFLTAFAYHAFNNPLRDEAAASEAAGCTVGAFAVLREAAEEGRLDGAKLKAAADAASNILFRGFLRDCLLEASAAVAAAVEDFLSAAGQEELAAFYARVRELIAGSVSKACRLSSGHGEARRTLSDPDNRFLGQLASSHLATRTAAAHLLNLEMLSVVARRKGGEVTVAAHKAVKEALAFTAAAAAQELPEKAARNLLTEIFKYAANFGDLLSSTDFRGLLKAMLLAAKENLSRHFWENKFVPTPRCLAIWCQLFELSLDREATEQPEELLSQLSKIAEKMCEEQRVCNVFLSFVCLSRFRLRYTQHRWRMEKEMEMERAAQKAKAGLPAPQEEDEEVKNIGDVNPYVMGLSKEQEEELLELLLQCLRHMEEASLFSTLPPPSPPLHVTLMGNMILTAADFFDLSGFSAYSEDAFVCLLKLAKAYSATRYRPPASKYRLLAAAGLLRLGCGDTKWASEAEEALKAVDPSEEEWGQLTLWAAVAKRDFHLVKFERSKRLSSLSLRRARELQDVGSIAGKVLLAELYRVRTLLCTVSGPGPEDRGEGEEEEEEVGPLELVADAYKYSASAVYYASSSYCAPSVKHPRWPELSRLAGLLDASRVHGEVLRTRMDLLTQVRMPKEMRLYAKLALEFAQSSALALGTADSLLTMAGVDLLCEEYDQAEAKMNGAKIILAATLPQEEVSNERLEIKSKTRRAVLLPPTDPVASPALVRQDLLSRLPSWTEHDVSTCACAECAPGAPAPVAVLRLVTAFGALEHFRGRKEEAHRFFQSADALLRVLRIRVNSQQEGFGRGQQLWLSRWVVDCLQWQLECYGRDRDVNKCRRILEEQAAAMLCVAGASSTSVGITRLRLCHTGLFLHMEEKRQVDLSGMEAALPTISPPSTPLLPRTAAPAAAAVAASDLCTPAPTTSSRGLALAPAVPAKPRKRLVPRPKRAAR